MTPNTFIQTDFTNCLQRYQEIIKSELWGQFCTSFKSSNLILLMGSGGNIAICEHMASDLSRHTGKSILSPGSLSDFTIRDPDMKIQNPYVRWVKSFTNFTSDIENKLIIAISSSGTSINLIEGLDHAKKFGFDTWVFAGKHQPEDHKSIHLNLQHYHEHEVTSMMLFYNLVEATNCTLPII